MTKLFDQEPEGGGAEEPPILFLMLCMVMIVYLVYDILMSLFGG